MARFKTRLHHYLFPSAAHPGYKAMCREIEANADGRGEWLHAYGGQDTMPTRTDVEVVEVETDHLFENQWNTADGRRVFDWYQLYQTRPERCGHWLEITPEMAESRRVTLKCGYCGHQYGPHHDSPTDDGFCRACLDSPHLKPEELQLLRLQPVIDDRKNRAPLTAAERAVLMESYVRRQTTGADSRAKKVRDRQRANVLSKFEQETAAALTERDGMLWLWDRGFNIDNVIYYSHTGRFGFGWRSKLAAEVVSALLDVISEFPFPYTIEAADGRKLESAAAE